MTETETNVLDQIESHISRYVSLPDGAGLVLSAYVLHSWTIESSHTTPYLFINSPEPRCGKSTLLGVLATLVRNPVNTVEITAPTLTRLIANLDRPTVMLDEIDCVYRGTGQGNQALRGILNAGYSKGGVVYRTAGQQVVSYDVYSPKIVAGIDNGKLPTTLLDRSIAITLQRKDAGSLEPFIAHMTNTDAILDSIEEWSDENFGALVTYPLETIPELGDRVSQLAHPLLAVANTFGRKEDMLSAIRNMFTTFKAHRAANDATLKTLRELSEIFDAEDTNKLHTDTILAYTGLKDGIALAAELKPFDIAPTTVRLGNHVVKGYKLSDALSAFVEHGVRSL